ncbi:ESPR-type extended signal peptide-containing protein [uncultured Psychrobacter sp.]
MLNHVYRVLSNRTTDCYIAVKEVAKSGSRYSNSVSTNTGVTSHDKI